MKVSSRTRTRNASLRTMADKLSIADDLEVSIFLTASSTSSSFTITGSILLSGTLPLSDQGMGNFRCKTRANIG